jgi:hypothetical protein
MGEGIDARFFYSGTDLFYLTRGRTFSIAWTFSIACADKTRTGDPDGDGFTNLQEFLFGTAPNIGNGALTSTEKSGGVLIIRWKQRATGTSYRLMESAALANPWTESTVTVESDGAQVGDYLPKKAQSPIASGKAFFRVEGVEN